MVEIFVTFETKQGDIEKAIFSSFNTLVSYIEESGNVQHVVNIGYCNVA